MTEQIGSRPQPIEQSVQPIDGDLSHDLRARADRRKLSGTASIAAGAVLATSLGAAAEAEQPNDTTPPPEMPTPIVSFMDIADTDNSGSLDLGEVLIGIPKYAEVVAQQAEELKAQEELSEFQSTKKLLNKIVNQKKEDIEKVTVKQIKKQTNKVFDQHAEELSEINIYGEEPLTKNRLKIYFDEIVNGSPLTKNARKEQEQSERSSAAGGLMYMFLDIYDKTEDPDLKRRAAKIADMSFDHIMTVIYDSPNKGLRKILKENGEIVLGLN